MKFEDLLTQQQSAEDKQTKLQLQKHVERLEKELDGELHVKRVLQCAIEGPIGCCQSCSSLSPLLPIKVQMLLAELSLLEEEIVWLEKRVKELKSDMYQEKKQSKQWKFSIQLKGLQPTKWDHQRQLKKLPSRRPSQMIQHKDQDTLSTSQNYETRRRHNKIPRDRRRASIGSSVELQTITKYAVETEEERGNARCSTSQVIHNRLDVDSESINPNKLSVELIKCLMGIFLKLNQSTCNKSKGTTTNLAKHNLTCINSNGLVCKATFTCTTPVFPFGCYVSQLDPYEILPEPDVNMRDIGPYKNFIQITRSTMDISRLSECLPDMWRLRVIMQKLSRINTSYFTHKQKLAFWINVYNASVMNVFLQHGLPSTHEKLQALMKEAVINVGGFVFKASTIEQFILRHPADIKHESIDEKEMLLRHSCGLGYPEPIVTFALCRGNWSSPALRFYTPDEVMNELEKAKVEYLEASIGITPRKKILVPKLMQWHMKDFADDMESLLEWIYSQLPYTSSLKRLMMECLNVETQSPPRKLIEIQPYASEFRYLIPVE